MKKKILTILCICLVVLSMGLLGACGDDNGKADPIIGTWIGQSDEDGVTRYFYAEIEKADKNYEINAKIVFENKNAESLTEGTITKNQKLENRYNYDGDFSPLPHGVNNLKYRYWFDIKDNDKITITEREFTNSDKLTGKIYIFERTTLTLEQYQEQLKAV